MVNCLSAIPSCTRCHLYKDMPDGCHPVPGDGPITANLMIVGEALGEQESLLELPFQGMAGRMLDKMLKEANLNREEIYLSNIIKCRPTKNNGKSNRPPTEEEIDKCKSWLYNEICVVQPKVIITLGKISTKTLLLNSIHMPKKTFTLKDWVGKQYIMNYCDEMEEVNFASTIVPAFHPSWLLQHGKQQVNQSIEVFKLAKEINNEQSKHYSV